MLSECLETHSGRVCSPPDFRFFQSALDHLSKLAQQISAPHSELTQDFVEAAIWCAGEALERIGEQLELARTNEHWKALWAREPDDIVCGTLLMLAVCSPAIPTASIVVAAIQIPSSAVCMCAAAVMTVECLKYYDEFLDLRAKGGGGAHVTGIAVLATSAAVYTADMFGTRFALLHHLGLKSTLVPLIASHAVAMHSLLNLISGPMMVSLLGHLAGVSMGGRFAAMVVPVIGNCCAFVATFRMEPVACWVFFTMSLGFAALSVWKLRNVRYTAGWVSNYNRYRATLVSGWLFTWTLGLNHVPLALSLLDALPDESLMALCVGIDFLNKLGFVAISLRSPRALEKSAAFASQL